VCIIAAPDVGKLVIFSFITPNLLSMSSISKLMVSKLNSLDIKGLDSPLDTEPELILLNATSFKSMSFSRFLARFRISSHDMVSILSCFVVFQQIIFPIIIALKLLEIKIIF